MILLGVKFDRSWKIGFHKMTPRCPPWCQSQFLPGVYFLSLFPFRLKTKWKKKLQPQINSETVCLAAAVFFRTKFHFFILSFFFSFPPWQYLPELDVCLFFRCFVAFVSFQLICHYPCSCRELSLMMRVWFFREPASLLLSDLTRRHQLSDEPRREKSKCECVEGDRDHFFCWWPQTAWGHHTRFVHITKVLWGT